jgi:hypothetical protein
MWHTEDLIERISAVLADADGQRLREQAVYGLDALDEVGLHAVLADGLAAGGLRVVREQPYPGLPRRGPQRGSLEAGVPIKTDVQQRSAALDDRAIAGVRGSARERCDLVLLHEDDGPLIDPVEAARKRAALPLFAADLSEVAASDPYWLEVKAVAQTTFVDGVPVPNASYGSLLVRGPAVDVAKLAADPFIGSAGVLVLVFGAEALGVQHDLRQMTLALIARDLPIASPSIACVPIEDRVGNTCCAVCLVPLRAVRESGG